MKGPAAKADWDMIRAEYEAGASQGELAKKHGVSRQRIGVKCRKEGWRQHVSLATPARNDATETDGEAPRVVLPPECSTDLAGPTNNKFSRERGQQVLNGLVEYGVFRVAAALAGVSPQTVLGWRERSPAFDLACQQALSARATRHLKALDRAEGRGDVKATELWLRANRMTREDFAKDEDSGGPAKIVVNINMPAGMGGTTDADQITIDGHAVTIAEP